MRGKGLREKKATGKGVGGKGVRKNRAIGKGVR